MAWLKFQCYVSILLRTRLSPLSSQITTVFVELSFNRLHLGLFNVLFALHTEMHSYVFPLLIRKIIPVKVIFFSSN